MQYKLFSPNHHIVCKTTINNDLLHPKTKLQSGHSLSKPSSKITNFIQLPQNYTRADLAYKLLLNFRLCKKKSQQPTYKSMCVFADASRY